MFTDLQGSPGGAHIEKLYKSAPKHKKVVGHLLSKIFSKEFTDDVTEVSLKNLLNWDMWPICLSIHSKAWRDVCMCVCVEGGGGVRYTVVWFIQIL